MRMNNPVSPEEELGLDALNYVNTILFYEEQLRRVVGGASIMEVLTQKERKILKRWSILVKNENKQRTGSALKVHWAVEALMDRLK